MQFKFDGEGEWTAISKRNLTWRIQVCDDGTFDVSRSDVDLLPATNRGLPCFENLQAAKDFCNQREEWSKP